MAAAQKVLGVNSTAKWVYLAVAKGPRSGFEVMSTKRISYSLGSAQTLRDLRQAISAILLDAKNVGVAKIAVLKCSSGPRGSSVDSIKAEGVVEVVAACDHGLEIQRVAPQSLKRVLECGGAKWQARAREIFNADGDIKYWSGTDGAVSAAYAASND